MKTLKIVGAVLIGLVIAFVVGGAVLSPKWRVERSIVVHAPPPAIYPLVANMKKGWIQWSPFDTGDPEIQWTYGEPEEGIGAYRSWKSKKMGDGSMKIVKADPSTGIAYKLEMTRNNFVLDGEVRFEPSGQDTKVVWVDSGEVGMNPVHRWMVRLMEPMMGPTFEKGLANLKAKAESAAAQVPAVGGTPPAPAASSAGAPTK